WQLVEAGAVALELLAGLRRTDVRDYSVGLANQFREALGMPPSDTTIVSVNGDPRHLADARVRCSGRGGRSRLSFYVYNDLSDVERAARALRVSAAA
ncbi:MAG: aminotransferase, partial [Demequina sp.]|nr:aminotransferase [Demequina sp.]